MSKLIPIVLWSLLLAFLADSCSEYDLDEYGCKDYLYKNGFWFLLLAISMSIFVGLRTSGNDTYVYVYDYNATSTNFSEIDWSNISSAPGLKCLQVILKRLGATSQDFLMLTSFFVNCVYLRFIKKYTSNVFLSVFYYITMGVFLFSMAAIKQTMAVAFLLLATDNAIEGRWIKYGFWLLIAEVFHPYSFIYLVVPFITFAPWSQLSYFLLAGTAVVAFGLSRFMGAIDDMTTMLGYANYSADEFSGAGVNIFRVVVVWVTVAISYIGRQNLKYSDDKKMNIIVNLAMMNAIIMFIGMFGTANYFARLANYFLIFQAIALPWLFRYISIESRKAVVGMSIVGYSLYFYYSNAIALGLFDKQYYFISFFDYLGQLF